MPPPDAAVAERDEAPNLPAERPQHPIIAKIDAKMPEIAQMLPEGMSADRFRRVVVQALVRNPDLWQCTPISVVSAIVEAAQLGLEPTGVLGRAWMLPYNVRQNDGTYIKEAKLIPGYRGYAELAWRADKILVTTGAVREGDRFGYQRGTDAFLMHEPASDDPEREADDGNITDFWAMYTLPDGRRDFDVMSRKAVERIRDKARKKNPVWDSDFGEMGRKTVLRRLLKVAPLSPEVQRILARDEEIDFDTPVERVPDPKRDGLRDRISQRTAALRGESSGESDAVASDGEAAPEGVSHPPSGGSSARKGDPWMARLHAVGAERGYDHEALHEWAERLFSVTSLADLDPKQRGQFMHRVEALPLVGQDCTHPPAKHVVTDTAVTCGECGGTVAQRGSDTPRSGSGEPDAATVPTGDGSPSSSAAPAQSVEAGMVSEENSERLHVAHETPASFTDPGTLETFAATVLGFDEPQPLKDLTPAEFEELWTVLSIPDLDAYEEWHKRQSREVRAALMAAKQSPRARRDAAKAVARAKLDGEQIRAALDTEA